MADNIRTPPHESSFATFLLCYGAFAFAQPGPAGAGGVEQEPLLLPPCRNDPCATHRLRHCHLRRHSGRCGSGGSGGTRGEKSHSAQLRSSSGRPHFRRTHLHRRRAPQKHRRHCEGVLRTHRQTHRLQPVSRRVGIPQDARRSESNDQRALPTGIRQHARRPNPVNCPAQRRIDPRESLHRQQLRR